MEFVVGEGGGHQPRLGDVQGDVLVAVDRAQVDGRLRIFDGRLVAVFAEPEEFGVLAAVDDGVGGISTLAGAPFTAGLAASLPASSALGMWARLAAVCLKALMSFGGLGI